MKTLPLSILFVLVTSVVLVNAVYSADPVEPRKLTAAFAVTPPAIDGKLDDACWKQAAQATGFSVFGNADSLHPEQTIARVCYDDDYLYIAMACSVNEMDKFNKRMTEAAGKFEYGIGGCIEVFLDTNHDRETFQQYLLHANGSSTMTLSKGDIFKILNEDYLVCRGLVTDTGYNVEMSFPLAMLHLHADTAKVWGFNLNRSHDLYDERYDKNGYFSSWNSTRGTGFQSPELFGELTMAIDFSRFYWNLDLVRVPQSGDAAIEFKIDNETGRDFTGKLMLRLSRDAGNAAAYEKDISIAANGNATVVFAHFVSAADVEAKYEVTIADADGKVVYLGGTQKKDLTPGDDRQPPTPTAAEAAAGFLAFQRPYTQPVLYKAVPQREEIVSALTVSACRGEFEPITFSLYPLRNLESLRVTAGALKGPADSTIPAAAIDVRKVSWQSDWKNPREFEAKEHLLRHFDSLALAQGRSKRFWLTIEVPQTTPAGEYRGQVTITADGAATRLPLTLEVLPFELLPPEGMGYFMYYPGMKSATFSNPEFFRKTVQDQRDHGMTTFSIYNWVKVEDPKTRKARIDLDTKVADNYGVTYAAMMDTLSEAGFGKNVPLFDVYSMHYGPELIVQLDKTCRKRGWPEVLFYIEDEIEYPERIARARKTLEGIRKISPEIKTTTALGQKGAAALGHMYDVWIGCSTPEMIKKCLDMGKDPWTYSCRADYDVGPAFERTFFGRFAWKIGLKGVGLWSYAEDNSFFDRFGRKRGYGDFEFTPEWKHQYGHVYFENGEIVPSVTWEAVREGIDDYRYMLTLKKLAETSESSKVLDEIAERTPIIADDKKFGRAWQELGDMDAERSRVIAAITNLHSEIEK